MLHRVQFHAMGTEMSILFQANPSVVGQERLMLERAAGFITSCEKRLSRFDAESELSFLNDHPGRPVRVSAMLFDLLTRAEEYWRISEGCFHPGILPALESAGYDHDFQSLTAGGAVMLEQFPQPPVDHVGFQLDPFLRTVLLKTGVRLDLGGIAKGWCADRTAEWLGKYGDVLVDAGGDIRTVGRKRWRVGVQLPGSALGLREKHPFLQRSLRLENSAVATSSVWKRRWLKGGRTMHHLINPKKGTPVDSGIAQATVVAESAEAAEVWAKTIIVAGDERARCLLRRSSIREAFWITVDGRVECY